MPILNKQKNIFSPPTKNNLFWANGSVTTYGTNFVNEHNNYIHANLKSYKTKPTAEQHKLSMEVTMPYKNKFIEK